MFTLEPERWYALERVLGAYQGKVPEFTPAFVKEVTPRKTGHGILGLKLNTGADELQWEAQVLRRAAEYMVVAIGNQNSAILRPVTFEWLSRFCPELTEQYPPPAAAYGEANVQDYLNQALCGQPSRRRSQHYDGERLVFDVLGISSSSGPVRAVCRDCSLSVQAEHLLALSERIRRVVQWHFPGRQDLVDNIVLRVKYDEVDVLIVCALRFDGYRYVDQVLDGNNEAIRRYIDRAEVPPDPLMQMATFFHLQRFLMKWGGEQLSHSGPTWRLFRTLCLQVADYPVPLQFQQWEYYPHWLHNYEPCREQAIEAVRRVHEATQYVDDDLIAQ
ncbi:MAG: hypothetical protein JXA09_11590 [Anaerolineae bacterium]|nr:hypothetical protein [Anaerolineae bacterium]